MIIDSVELMLLGFVSLLLTVGQGPISRICISEKVAGTWHPCSKKLEQESGMKIENGTGRRRLLSTFLDSGSGNSSRVLAAAEDDQCAAKVCVCVIVLTLYIRCLVT